MILPPWVTMTRVVQIEHVMSSHYTTKIRTILGVNRNEAKEVRILNRYVRWDSDGERCWIEYEPDPRHPELIVKSLDLERAKGVTTPSVKIRLEEVLMTSLQFDALQTRQDRGVVMRAAYLSQDRPDLSYSTKELARNMQKPTEQSMTHLKRRNVHDLYSLFIEQTSTASVVRLDVYGDSDHAGWSQNTQGHDRYGVDCAMHIVAKCRGHTQSTISLSSDESEYYGIVKCAGHWLRREIHACRFWHVC